jgi:hypothetical protein
MISGVVVLRTRHGLRCRPRVTASALSAAGRADLGGGGFPTRLSRIRPAARPGGNALERPNVIVTIRFAGCAIDESEMFESGKLLPGISAHLAPVGCALSPQT